MIASNLYLIVGWIGALTLMLSYTAVTLGLIEGKSRWYPFLNMTGSIMTMVASYYLNSTESIAYGLICLPISFLAAIGRFPDIKFNLPKLSFYIGIIVFSISLFIYIEQDLPEYIFSILGTFGVYLLIAAYIMVLSKQIEDYHYFLLNLIAGAIFIPILMYDSNYPKVADEGWGIILTLYGIYRILKTKNNALNKNITQVDQPKGL